MTKKRPVDGGRDSSSGGVRRGRGDRGRGGAIVGARRKVHRGGDRRTGAAKTAEGVPQHLQDSRKYQRYSLANVDTSDRTNTAAALSFLSSRGGGTKHANAGSTHSERATRGGTGDEHARHILGSGSGVVKFRPRHKQPMQTGQPMEPNKRRRVGKLLEEVVVGQHASGGAGRRQAHGKTGRERAIAAGLLRTGEDGTGAPEDMSDALSVGEAEQTAAERKAIQRKKTAEQRKPAVALSHLQGDESDD
jgi:hypothetical protein